MAKQTPDGFQWFDPERWNRMEELSGLTGDDLVLFLCEMGEEILGELHEGRHIVSAEKRSDSVALIVLRVEDTLEKIHADVRRRLAEALSVEMGKPIQREE